MLDARTSVDALSNKAKFLNIKGNGLLPNQQKNAQMRKARGKRGNPEP